MRIGCLQFAPRLGEVDNNLNEADDILSKANPEDLDLLVLPELAFSGYNFKSLQEIYPFLEPTVTGITSVWARNAALRYDCAVAVGYPETADVSHKWPTSPEYYNALIVVNRDGDTWANYRKSHLYYTDESWALEGDGFWKGFMPGIGKIALGICMDINPYKFEAPWDQFEFATYALEVAANVILVSMAWLTREEPHIFNAQPSEPDLETLTYWVKRMEPLIRSDESHEVVVIFSNRAGTEGDATYAGTSAVLGIQNGEVTVYGLLGRGEKQLLVVDTSKPGFAKMVYRPEDDSQSIAGQENAQADSRDLFGPGSDTGYSPGNGERRDPELQSSRDKTQGHATHREDRHPPQHQEPVYEVLDDFPPGSFKEPSPFPNFSLETLSRELGVISEQSPPRTDRPELPLDDLQDQISLSTNHAKSHISAAIEPEPTTEFWDLVKALQDPCPAQDVQVARPFSTKSRNASRAHSRTTDNDGTLDQTGNATTRCSLSYVGDFGSVITSKSAVQQVSSMPKPDGADDQGIYQRPPASSSAASRYDLGSEADQLDMERIGADLMVFEEDTANRIKRQSLVCHVDDDDYIVLRTMRKDGNPIGYKSSKSGRFPSRPSSRQTPQCPDSTGYDMSRSEMRNTRSMNSSAPTRHPRSSQFRSAICGESEFKLDSPTRSVRQISSASDCYDSEAPSLSSWDSQSSQHERFPRAGYSSQDHIVEHQNSLPNPRSGHRGGNSSYSQEDVRAVSSKNKFVFSPRDMLVIDPDIDYTGTMEATVGLSVTVAGSPADRAPSTPKAMKFVVEPDK